MPPALAAQNRAVALEDESGEIDWFRDIIVATEGRLPGITGGEMMASYYYLAGGLVRDTGAVMNEEHRKTLRRMLVELGAPVGKV